MDDFTVLKVIFLFMFTVSKWSGEARKEEDSFHIGVVYLLISKHSE